MAAPATISLRDHGAAHGEQRQPGLDRPGDFAGLVPDGQVTDVFEFLGQETGSQGSGCAQYAHFGCLAIDALD
jgi:hypothetical protein